MKLSDYIFSFLRDKGVNTVFYLPGGGCMHLLDSLGKHKDISAVSMLHEQAVAIAAEAYANTNETPGVALVTTGPGGTNAVTGTLAAYLDSSPCFFVSGQVKTSDLKNRFGVRSMGSQESDIVSIVKSITKYAVMVTDKNTIRYHLERAWYEMTSGRQGPVWIDIPLDIQGAQIDPEQLDNFMETKEKKIVDITTIIESLNRSKQPVIIAGNGLSRCKDDFFRLLEVLQVPVIPTWKAIDYIPNDHDLYAGRVGGMGDRHGNLTMQNSDLILSMGSRLDFSITGYDRTKWAPKALKIVIDIDKAEMAKFEGTLNLIPFSADVETIIKGLLKRKNEISMNGIQDWHKKISEWKTKYPVVTKEKYITIAGKLTSYAFIDTLSKLLPKGAFIAPCSAGTTAEIFFQAFTVKQGQVIRSNHGLGSMGFELPNAIGMCIASGKKDIICVAGDGGIQLNIQELAVIRGRNLPVKIFVINNDGYASIRNMQNNHFQGHHIGCDENCGLYLPNIREIAAAYGLPYFRANSLESLEESVKKSLEQNGPVICEIIVDSECLVTPRSATVVMPDGSMCSSPLENQFPFLPDEEIEKNMTK